MFSELNGRLASKIVVFFDDSMRGILKKKMRGMVLRRVGDWIKIRYYFKYKVERNASNDLYRMERNPND